MKYVLMGLLFPIFSWSATPEMEVRWGYPELDSQVTFQKKALGKTTGFVVSLVTQGELKQMRAVPEKTYGELMKEFEQLTKEVSPASPKTLCTLPMEFKKNKATRHFCGEKMSAGTTKKIREWTDKIEQL